MFILNPKKFLPLQLCWTEKTKLSRISFRYFLPGCIFLWLCFLLNYIITTANLFSKILVSKRRRKLFPLTFQKVNPAIVLPVIFWQRVILWFRNSFLSILKTIHTRHNKLFLYRKKSGQRPNSLFNFAVLPPFHNFYFPQFLSRFWENILELLSEI